MYRRAVRVLGFLFAIACALHGAASVAHAQDDARSLDAARAELEAGRLAYENGEFEVALDRFERAYELSGSADLLYNVATCADRLRRDDVALDSYERYLEAAPETEDRAQIEGRIRALRAALAREGSRVEPAPAPSEAGPAPHAHHRLFTWIALGVSVALGATTAGLWAGAQSSYDSFSACAPSCDPAEVGASSGHALQTAGNVLFGLSLAALAGAVVLFFVEPKDDAAEPAVAVSLGPAAVALRGRF